MASISSMPSASLISSNQPPSSGNLVLPTSEKSMAAPVIDTNLCGEGPLGQALQVVEKKVRNLEKRKGKLDGYRADYQRGKTLNDDQKAAIAKYDEVLQTLEFARELSSQFKTLAIEEEKTRKKQIKKDLQERNKAEIERIASTIEVQDLLKCISIPKSKADLLSGENGASPKLTKDQIGHLEEFGRLVRPTRRQHDSPEEFEKVLTTSAEHISKLIEGSSKKVGKTTYKELKSLLDAIKVSGYFDGKNQSKSGEALELEEEMPSESPKKDATDGNVVPKENNRKKVTQNGQEQDKREGGRRDKKRGSGREERLNEKAMAEQKINDQSKPRQQYEGKPAVSQNHPEQFTQPMQQNNAYHPQQTNMMAEPTTHQPVPMTAASTQPTMNQQYHHATQQQTPQQMNTVAATPTAPGINFLQESQIDMESPHMDPAVVVVHHTAPPTQGQASLPPNQQPPNIATTVQNQVHLMHQQASIQQTGGIATTISGFTNQNGAANPSIAFMPQTAAMSAMQPQHVAYGQAPFQHQQQQQQHNVVPSQPQIQAQQQQKPMEEPEKQDNQEPKQHIEESQRGNMSHNGPSAPAAKPQGYAAALASRNGMAYNSNTTQQNGEAVQDTMPDIGDWNADDVGNNNSETRNDNRNGFRNGNGRGGYRGGRGDRGGRNQNGERSGYRGNGGYRGSERGERNNRNEYNGRRGGGRGGGSGERNDRGGRGQDRQGPRSDRGGKDFRG